MSALPPKADICGMSALGQKRTLRNAEHLNCVSETSAKERHRHPSFEQSRGTIFFSAAYWVDTSITIGSVIVSSAMYQSEITFQILPSHCWMRAVLAPS